MEEQGMRALWRTGGTGPTTVLLAFSSLESSPCRSLQRCLLLLRDHSHSPLTLLYIVHGICLEALKGPCLFACMFPVCFVQLFRMYNRHSVNKLLNEIKKQTTHSNVSSNKICDLVPLLEDFRFEVPLLKQFMTYSREIQKAKNITGSCGQQWRHMLN